MKQRFALLVAASVILGILVAGATYYQRAVNADAWGSEDWYCAPYYSGERPLPYESTDPNVSTTQCQNVKDGKYGFSGSICYWHHNRVTGENRRVQCFPPVESRLINMSDCEKSLPTPVDPYTKYWCEQAGVASEYYIHANGESGWESRPYFDIKRQRVVDGVEFAIVTESTMGGRFPIDSIEDSYALTGLGSENYSLSQNQSPTSMPSPMQVPSAASTANSGTSTGNQTSLSARPNSPKSSTTPNPTIGAATPNSQSTLRTETLSTSTPDNTTIAQASSSPAFSPSPKVNPNMQSTYNPEQDLTPWQQFVRWVRNIFS